MVALQYDKSVLDHPEQALKELEQRMMNALPDYFSAQDIIRLQENDELRNFVSEQKKVIELQEKAVSILDNQVNAQDKTIRNLRSQLDEYKEIIKEQESIINSLNAE